MEALFDILGQIFNVIWAIIIIYLLIKVWNGFWNWLFPRE
tara:strand:+ start:14946 stop:15065 length:120 start_codon:yes stop_codon:yes gene_type:complete